MILSMKGYIAVSLKLIISWFRAHPSLLRTKQPPGFQRVVGKELGKYVPLKRTLTDLNKYQTKKGKRKKPKHLMRSALVS